MTMEIPDDPRFKTAVSALEQGRFQDSFAIARQLAGEGDAMGMHFLGWHYHKGIGIEQDDTAAVTWWQRAAHLGCANAVKGLGWACETGRGLERDTQAAYHHYLRAIMLGDDSAREALFELALQMPPEAIKRAESLVETPAGDDQR